MPAGRNERLEWIAHELLQPAEQPLVSWTCRERHLTIQPANGNAHLCKVGAEVGQRFQVSAEGHVSTYIDSSFTVRYRLLF